MLTLVIHILYVCYTAFPFLYPTYRYILRPPVLVNSSTVFLQFQANRQNVDRFEAAYAFHDGTSSLFFLILLLQGTIPILCQSIFGLLRPTHYVSIKNVDRFEAAYAFHDGTSSLFFLILLLQGTIPILCQSIFGLLRPTHYVSIKNVDRFEAAYAFHDGTSSLFSDPSSLRDHPYIMSAHFWTFKTHPLHMSA